MRLLVATTNPNKVREIRPLLTDIDVITLDRFPSLDAPEETGRSFEENARQKAIFYASATGELTVAEDSGLEIDALDGAPGVESARYGGAELPYAEKFMKLHAALRGRGAVDPTGRFVCALALARDHRILFTARGSVEGRIAREARGHDGFGYDPIFFYPPYRRTFGEVSHEQKSAVSHRSEAFRQLREFLTSLDRKGR